MRKGRDREHMGNTLKTTLLLAVLTVLFVLVGKAIGGESGMVFAFGLAVVMNVGSYWFSDKIVLRMYSAREVTESESPQLHGMVRRLAPAGRGAGRGRRPRGRRGAAASRDGDPCTPRGDDGPDGRLPVPRVPGRRDRGAFLREARCAGAGPRKDVGPVAAGADGGGPGHGPHVHHQSADRRRFPEPVQHTPACYEADRAPDGDAGADHLMMEISFYREKFSEPGRRLLNASIEESQRRHHYYLGLEHLV